MKNYLTLVIGLVIVATPAFASRARLEALQVLRPRKRLNAPSPI